MHRDLAGGRRSGPLDQVGAVARLGDEVGVATPIHATLPSAPLPLERAARGEAPQFSRTRSPKADLQPDLGLAVG
jgi:hypothetical protein